MTTSIPAPLLGKSALVTGGSRGIGAGIALAFAHKGCTSIAITYSTNASSANQVLESIRAVSPHIKTAAIKADLLSPTFGKDVVDETLSKLGVETIDIVVSNAALLDIGHAKPMEQNTKALFDELMTANAWSPLQLALSALPHMKRGGRIVMISSVASKRANADPVVLYGASKSALDGITRGLATMYAREKGVTVNGVAVGPTNTDAVREAIEKMPKEWGDRLRERPSAERRIGEVEDVVGVVAWLASEESKWLNGNYVPCNGGAMLELQG